MLRPVRRIPYLLVLSKAILRSAKAFHLPIFLIHRNLQVLVYAHHPYPQLAHSHELSDQIDRERRKRPHDQTPQFQTTHAFYRDLFMGSHIPILTADDRTHPL